VVPATEPTADFHRLAFAHAGQTKKTPFWVSSLISTKKEFFYTSNNFTYYVLNLLSSLLKSCDKLLSTLEWFEISSAQAICSSVLVEISSVVATDSSATAEMFPLILVPFPLIS
jgi:hypothetical protein